ADAKAEIFAGLSEGGTAVIPADSAHAALLADRARAAGAKIVTFGDSVDAGVRLADASPVEAGGGAATSVRAHIAPLAAGRAQDISFTLGVSGHHLVTNALGVAGALAGLGVPLAPALAALADMSAPEG